MRTFLRILLVWSLGCLAPIVLVSAPSTAAATVTLRAISIFPQVGGELTLMGTVAGADPTPTAVDVERWVPGTGWVVVDATGRVDDDGGVLASVPLSSGPMAVAGGAWVRVVLTGPPGAPPTVSDRLGVFVFANAAPPFSSAPHPAVSGTHTVGSVLTASTGTWAPAPAFVALQWNRDGVKTATTGATYTVTAADLGHVITVSAVAFPQSGTGSTFTVRDSRPEGPVKRGTFAVAAPEILGRAQLGEVLRVDVGSWSPAPEVLSYQWTRDGMPIDGATAPDHTVTEDDAGTNLAVNVHGASAGIDPADVTSPDFVVPAELAAPGELLGDLMQPGDRTPLASHEVQLTTRTTVPTWPAVQRTWWTSPAFTHSQEPVPFLTLASAMFGQDWAREVNGAEYVGTNVSLKNIDVSFTITARRFAISYRATRTQDAMVWLDGRPVSATPVPAQSPSDTAYVANWIVIELPERRTVRVRFAGPSSFTGVDVPGDEGAVITASPPPPLTVGVVSDSLFDLCAESRCMSRAAAPLLATLTGWRVWNLAESGTGYLSPSSAPGYGSFQPSIFGSSRRLAALERAPLDLLLVNGSVNDASMASYTPEAHRAAVERYLEDLARTRPGLPVVLIGIEPLGRYQSRYWDDRARAMTANLAAMVGRHPNVIGFIDPYTDRWLTGTGSISAPKGDGNQDEYVGTDGVHLSVAGVAHYVGRILDELSGMRLP